MPIILVGERYWRRAFDVDFFVSEGVIDPEDRELFWHAETAEQISTMFAWSAKYWQAVDCAAKLRRETEELRAVFAPPPLAAPLILRIGPLN